MPDVTRPKVVYLVGKGRAGGTLLNDMLGQIDGWTCPGELPRLWTWGFTEGWRCGCGLSVPECPFWAKVVEEAFGSADAMNTEDIVSWQNEILSWKRVPRMLSQARHRRPWPELDRYIEVLQKVYGSLANVTGGRVIVESTRWSTSPTALGLVPGIDVYLLHLVRDPRAVVYSWKRKKLLIDRPGNPEMQRFGALYTMTSLWARTVLAEVALKRARVESITVRYEDFIQDPRGTLSLIASSIGEPEPDLGFIQDGAVELDVTHTVGGNPSRLERGRVAIRPDDAWKNDQPKRDRWVATLLGAPLMKRYGYPLRPRRP